MSDAEEILTFIQQYSFASIITHHGDKPIATHLPFMVSEREGKIVLHSHFAKANDHWQIIEGNTSLIIFSEPHAYISPSNYEKKMNVPTWNYLAVHAYGTARIIFESLSVRQILEHTIVTYESEYLHQWNDLPEEYKAAMEKGIVAFELVVDEVHAKKKLSQNKTHKEKENIVNQLINSKNSNEKAIADYMAKENNE
jgi:transcriptional regulator